MTTSNTVEYTTPGTFTYDIPNWIAVGGSFDVVLVGDGGGGHGGAIFAYGSPGGPGTWTAATLKYGTDIPVSTTWFSVTIEPGGVGGRAFQAGSPGSGTSVTIPGYGTLTAAGGGAGAGANNYPGPSPGNYVFDDVTYPGGAEQLISGQSGNAAGGGGAGGSYDSHGGDGAPGAVWIMAYQPVSQ